MPTIRDRIAQFILGPERERLQQTTRILYNAYLDGKYAMTPEDLVKELKEVDSSLLFDMVNQMYYEQIGVLGYAANSDDTERQYAVKESRRLWRYDVITQWIIWLWTNYGFGETLTITPKNKKAQTDWKEFWDADRNQPLFSPDKLQGLSEILLVDGEIFFAFYVSTLDGKSTLRTIEPLEITEIVTDPEDNKHPLFYKRIWTDRNNVQHIMYYPDAMAYMSEELDKAVLPKDAIRADKIQEGTTISIILHASHNIKSGLRGWPLMVAGAPWTRAHKKFQEDRASVASSVAMFVRKIKAKTGTRGIASLRAQLNTTLSQNNMLDQNPPPVAGSTYLENDAADMTNLPLSTGASDAKTDGQALLKMAALGGGVFPHWMGEGDAYRLATATSMEGPLLREFSRYQQFWGAQFRKMVRIVLTMLEDHGKKYPTYEADVSTDKLIEVDLTALSSSVQGIFAQAFTPVYAAGLMPDDVAVPILRSVWTVLLNGMGVADVDEIVNEKTWPIPEPEPPPEPAPVVDPNAVVPNPDGTTPPPPADGTQPPVPAATVPPAAAPAGEGSHNGHHHDDEDDLAEQGKKFKPSGKPLPAFTNAVVPITNKDVDAAIRAFNQANKGQLKGLLQAKKQKAEGAKK